MPALAHWRITDEIPLRLPLLDRWLEHAAQDWPLEGVTLLNIQHQLGNHVPQTVALIELGVSPTDIYWIEIPYSATPAVREVLYGLGIPKQNILVSDFHLLDDYANYQRARVQHFLHAFADDPPKLLLVLDDGAYMLETLAALRRPLPSLAIVEQTTRGLIKMEDSRALAQRARELRIVNVARSTPKVTLEPPFIGAAVTEALARRLAPRFAQTKKLSCLVLGYGVIGKQVAAFLAAELGFARASIYVSDVLDERMRQAEEDGFGPGIWRKRCASTSSSAALAAHRFMPAITFFSRMVPFSRARPQAPSNSLARTSLSSLMPSPMTTSGSTAPALTSDSLTLMCPSILSTGTSRFSMVAFRSISTAE